ncbi:27833_t:CDS:2, partial [Dentiscutata erythropus]
GSDGNCYLEKGQSPEQFVAVGFIMMAIFCWMIFGLITFQIYMMWNSLSERMQSKQKWRQILFNDGLFYLGLISSFQTINVIFILASEDEDYLNRFINVTPALILTVKAPAPIVQNNSSFFQNNSSFVQNSGSIIINSMLEVPIATSRNRSISSNNSFAGIPISPPTPIMVSDFGTSLTTFFNNYTSISLESSQPSSKHTSSIRRSQGRVTESNDYYYFRYSEANEFDDDIFLFPAIPPQAPSKPNVKPPRPGFF